MRVEEVMTKGVRSCAPGATLADAARIMWQVDCGCVPVVESGERPRLVGILTDRDICMAAYSQEKSLPEIAVGDAMSSRVRTCTAAEHLEAAEATMRAAQVRRLPVVDDSGQLVGIISLSDIARELARERASAEQQLSGLEVGETLAAICEPRRLGSGESSS